MPYKDKTKQREHNHRPEVIAKRREYEKTRPKRVRTRVSRILSEAQKEKKRLHDKQHYQRNKSGKHQLKIDVLTHYGKSKCACILCGYDNEMALSIDHIDGNGATHRRSIHSNGGERLYRWLVKHNYPEGFQTLCMNCQWIKKRMNNEYGWQKGKRIDTTSNQFPLFNIIKPPC